MNHPKTEELLNRVLEKDDRYAVEAYIFVQEALEYTVSKLKTPRHVSGQELLEGIREYALQEYGPMAKRVLNEWGLKKCIDFGHVVFNLVDEGLLGKSENDRLEDFSNGYHFDDAFVKPFRLEKTGHSVKKHCFRRK